MTLVRVSTRAGVDVGDQFIGVGGDDGEGLEPRISLLRSLFGLLPSIPRAGEGERLAVGELEAVGLFGPRVDLLPFVETGGWDDAASALEGFSVGGRGSDGLGGR